MHTIARCQIPPTAAAPRVSVEITNTYGYINSYFNTSNTTHPEWQECAHPHPTVPNICEGKWSTKPIFMTYVPQVHRISKHQGSVGEQISIVLQGIGFRTTNSVPPNLRQSKCIFVDHGVRGLFSTSTSSDQTR